MKATNEQDLAVYRERIGRNPLGWILEVAQRPPEKMTAGDWENVRHELAIFARFNRDPFSAATSPGAGQTWIPTEAEARDVCAALPAVFQKIVAHEPVLSIAARPSATSWLIWDRSSRRYQRRLSGDTVEAKDRILDTLAQLVAGSRFGIRACEARRARGKKREKCGRWFVATRELQQFCSTRCQNREKAPRARSKTRQAKGAGPPENLETPPGRYGRRNERRISR